MRAEIDAVEPAARRFDGAGHAGMDRGQRRGREQAATHAGLIAGHHDGKARPGQSGDGLDAARERQPLLGAADEIRRFPVDDAVPVQDDQTPFGAMAMGLRSARNA